MKAAVPILSLISVLAFEQPAPVSNDEATVLMQATVSSDGSINHEQSFTLDSSSFRFSVKHPDADQSETFNLKEIFPFAQGIRHYAADKSFTVTKPSFRTFKSDRGQPLALAQVHADGHTVAFGSINGISHHMERKHDEAEFFAQPLDFTIPEVPKVVLGRMGIRKRKECDTDCQRKKHKHEEVEIIEKNGLTKTIFRAVDKMNKSTVQKLLNTYTRFHKKGLMTDPGKPSLAQAQDEQYESWIGSCFPDDTNPQTMKIGIIVDRQGMNDNIWYGDSNHRRRYSFPGNAVNDPDSNEYDADYTNNTWQGDIGYAFLKANYVYQGQFNVELVPAWVISWDNDVDAPDMAKCPGVSATGGNTQNILYGLRDFVNSELGSYSVSSDVAAVHMFSGCNTAGYGTAGQAFVGTLCSEDGSHTGVTYMNFGWDTFAHELGHNFGANHVFDDPGYDGSGGIMSYDTGGIYKEIPQFNTDFSKDDICDGLLSAAGSCSVKSFSAACCTDPVQTEYTSTQCTGTPIQGTRFCTCENLRDIYGCRNSAVSNACRQTCGTCILQPCAAVGSSPTPTSPTPTAPTPTAPTPTAPTPTAQTPPPPPPTPPPPTPDAPSFGITPTCIDQNMVCQQYGPYCGNPWATINGVTVDEFCGCTCPGITPNCVDESRDYCLTQVPDEACTNPYWTVNGKLASVFCGCRCGVLSLLDQDPIVNHNVTLPEVTFRLLKP